MRRIERGARAGRAPRDRPGQPDDPPPHPALARRPGARQRAGPTRHLARLRRGPVRPGAARRHRPEGGGRAAALRSPSPASRPSNVMLLAVSVWAGHVSLMGEGTRDLPALVRGAGRTARHRVRRPPVLPLGPQGAPVRPDQHGRADLAGRDPRPLDEPVGDRQPRPARLLRQRHHAALLPPGRPLPRPARPRQRPRRRRAAAGPGCLAPSPWSCPTAPPAASGPSRSRPARRSWSPPASGSASTAPSWSASARSTPA